MGSGANRNLKPEFGRLENLEQLKKRILEL
jgi:hypothetical protein